MWQCTIFAHATGRTFHLKPDKIKPNLLHILAEFCAECRSMTDSGRFVNEAQFTVPARKGDSLDFALYQHECNHHVLSEVAACLPTAGGDYFSVYSSSGTTSPMDGSELTCSRGRSGFVNKMTKGWKSTEAM